MNGSDINIGCHRNVVKYNDEVLCGTLSNPAISYLTDGITPDINTSALNWASQLVTVRKNTATSNIPYDHVVLVFDTFNPVNLTSVELDMFICPQWNIGAPNITVYADENGGSDYEFNASDNRIEFRGTISPSQLCCWSLSTVRILLQNTKYGILWYIVIRFELNPDIQWIHVGEVRLLTELTQPTSKSNRSIMFKMCLKMHD